jgi:uncharacterized protein
MTQRVPEPLWKLLYEGTDITGDIAPQVTEVQWIDRLGSQTPEISLTVADPARAWMRSRYPQPQDLVELYIGYAGAPLFTCGTFSLDEYEFEGPPSRVTLRGVEAWTSAPIRTPSNFAYENMTFSQIAQAVAARHGWGCVNLPTEPDTPWGRRTQTLEHGGDVNFLRMISSEANYEFNVRPPNIIFYSRAAIDAQPPVGTITYSMVSRYDFKYQSLAEHAVGSSTVSYLDPMTKQVYTATAKVTGTAPTADALNIVERVENNQQAALKAASRLYEADMLQYQLMITLPGTTSFRAGQTVSLPADDWGVFGAKWTLAQAVHRIRGAGGGYVTELTLRQAGPGSVLTPGGAST